MLFVFVSVPLIFMSGISWPTSNMPTFWKVFAQIFPSTHGVNGFARINTAGALLQDVRTESITLWIQSGVYFMLSLLIYERLYRSDKMPGAEFVLSIRSRMRKDIRVAVRDIKEAREELKEKADKLRNRRKLILICKSRELSGYRFRVCDRNRDVWRRCIGKFSKQAVRSFLDGSDLTQVYIV